MNLKFDQSSKIRTRKVCATPQRFERSFDTQLYITSASGLLSITPVSLRLSSMSTNSSDTTTLLRFPTEILIRTFAHLQVADLLSVQHTCRRFYDVILESVSLQYFLHTEVNLLEDLSPPDFSLNERVALLKRHETAWKNMEFNKSTRFLTSEESHAYRYILQDGYLIYEDASTNTAQYGYIDLYSSSALPNAEEPWTHIPLANIARPLSSIVFAVDHDLVVAIRYIQYFNTILSPDLTYSDSSRQSDVHGARFAVAVFLEFTTGARHPLSLVPTVSLPTVGDPEVEVFGDYLLATWESTCFGHGFFSVVSWKTGTYTEVSGTSELLQRCPKFEQRFKAL